MLRIPRVTAQVKAPKYCQIEQINFLLRSPCTNNKRDGNFVHSITYEFNHVPNRSMSTPDFYIHPWRNLSPKLVLISDIHASVHP